MGVWVAAALSSACAPEAYGALAQLLLRAPPGGPWAPRRVAAAPGLSQRTSHQQEGKHEAGRGHGGCGLGGLGGFCVCGLPAGWLAIIDCAPRPAPARGPCPPLGPVVRAGASPAGEGAGDPEPTGPPPASHAVPTRCVPRRGTARPQAPHRRVLHALHPAAGLRLDGTSRPRPLLRPSPSKQASPNTPAGRGGGRAA